MSDKKEDTAMYGDDEESVAAGNSSLSLSVEHRITPQTLDSDLNDEPDLDKTWMRNMSVENKSRENISRENISIENISRENISRENKSLLSGSFDPLLFENTTRNRSDGSFSSESTGSTGSLTDDMDDDSDFSPWTLCSNRSRSRPHQKLTRLNFQTFQGEHLPEPHKSENLRLQPVTTPHPKGYDRSSISSYHRNAALSVMTATASSSNPVKSETNPVEDDKILQAKTYLQSKWDDVTLPLQPLSSSLSSYWTSSSRIQQYIHPNMTTPGASSSASKKPPSSLFTLLEDPNEDDAEDENGEECAEQMLYNTVDRIEDEIDSHTFYEYTPLSLRLFLEENIFGWSHVFSDIFAHTFYPLAAWVLTYYTFSYVIWYIFPSWQEGPYGYRYRIFVVLRVLFSLQSLIVTFRTIRRRREVWLRSSYGSRAYAKDAENRRASLKEVDRGTLLGRIRKGVKKRQDAILAVRVRRKLSKANDRFEKKKRARAQLGSKKKSGGTAGDSKEDSTLGEEHPGVESIARDQVYLAESLEAMPYAHGGFFAAAPFLLADPIWVDILRTLMPDVYVEVARRIFSPPAKLIHWAENNPVVAAYGTVKELEAGKIEVSSIEWDVFLDPNLVSRLELVLKEKERVKLLILQMEEEADREGEDHFNPHTSSLSSLPQLKEEFQSLMKSSKENLHEQVQRLQQLELKTQLYTHHLLDKMLIAHGNTTQLALEQTGYLKQYIFSRVKRTRRTLGGGIFAKQWLALYAAALKMAMSGWTANSEGSGLSGVTSPASVSNSTGFNTPTTMSRTPSFVDLKSEFLQTMAINADAEGDGDDSNWDADIEYHSQHNSMSQRGELYESPLQLSPEKCTIKRTNSNNMLAVPPSTPTLLLHKHSQDISGKSLQDLTKSTCPNYPTNTSLAVIREILGCPPSFVLDLKSRHVPKLVLAHLIDALRECGARVNGIGTFIGSEIRDISSMTFSPVQEILFFHSAGDIQKACHEGLIRRGDVVFFNAGSLLWKYPSKMAMMGWVYDCVSGKTFDPNEMKGNYTLQSYACWESLQEKDERGYDDDNNQDDHSIRVLSSTIRDYKSRYDLNIGLYCQEFAIDDGAIDLITRHVNHNKDIYNMGLSWGGLNGVSVSGIQPGRFTSTDGFWNQRYIGVSWDTDLYPPNTLEDDYSCGSCEHDGAREMELMVPSSPIGHTCGDEDHSEMKNDARN